MKYLHGFYPTYNKFLYKQWSGYDHWLVFLFNSYYGTHCRNIDYYVNPREMHHLRWVNHPCSLQRRWLSLVPYNLQIIFSNSKCMSYSLHFRNFYIITTLTVKSILVCLSNIKNLPVVFNLSRALNHECRKWTKYIYI